MKKLLFIVCFFFIATISYGELIKQPDKNTYWIENGKNIKTGEKPSLDHWQNSIPVVPAENGFMIEGLSPGEGKGTAIGRYLPFSPDYPYLVWKITKVERKKGYRGLTFLFPDKVVFNFVTHIYPGIFAVNVFNYGKVKSKNPWCRIYVYGAKVYFEYLKMVKKPDYYIEISPPPEGRDFYKIGDKISFKVIMKKEAEDVTLSFFDSYVTHPVSLNNLSRLQLKPEKENCKVWKGEITVKQAPNKDFKTGTFLIKATILGGGIKEPLWTANYKMMKFKKE